MDEQTAYLQAAFERRVLRGLTAEWSAAAAELEAPYDGMVRLPLFALQDAGTRLGQWCAGRCEIRLSRRLIAEHPWDSVREVLYHEMAHQLADAMTGGRQEAPHGPVFRRACRLLGANPRASGTYPTLHERILSGVVAENDRLLLRIQKLLALAGSRNPHEAEAAMLKAHALIDKYNLDLVRRDAGRRFASIFLGGPALRHFRESYHLARLLQEHYFVEGIWVTAWVLEKGRMGRVLEISGTESNVKMADYVHDFVLGFIDAQWERFNRKRRLGRRRKTDFAVGVIEGFREKLARAGQRSTPETGGDLVCLNDPQLKRYVRHRYPKIRSFRRGGGQSDEAVITAGLLRGRKLVIARGVEHRNTGARLRLPGGRAEKNG